jgi:acyl-CoA thioester hydrolase
MPTSATFTMPVRVRYVECDMQNRVFNAHYLTWVDMAHTEALDRLVGYEAMVAAGVDVVVVGAELDFRAPARFNDQLLVHTTFHPPGNTSLRSDFRITRDDDLLAEVRMTHVCVDTVDYAKLPWPQWLRDKLPSAD